MNKFFFIFTLSSLILLSCSPKTLSEIDNKKANDKAIKGDTITIANPETEYQVIIIDPGFSNWLYTRAYPRGYHTLSYLENKNKWYVNEWNNRVSQPQIYNPSLYEMQINYEPTISYGYEVNYMIYNYMIYFQNTYKQKLFGFVPQR